MRNRVLVKALSLSLAVMLPFATAFGEMSGAILRSSNGALLNGVNARAGSAVLNGDTIQAVKGSTVSISAKNGSVVLYGDSQVRYMGDSVSLQSGKARVATSNGMSANVDRITVKPMAKSGSFEVAKQDGKVVIVALNGPVSVFDANHSMVVPEGNVANLDPEQNDENDKKKPRTPAVWTGGNGGWGMSTKAAIITGVAAAGAAATALVLTTGSPDASPVHP